MKIIYLDNAATTKVDEKVFKAMEPYLKEEYGNASSTHFKGVQVKEVIEKSRKIIADSLNSKPEEIYFTSGGTESNNWALKGLFWENNPEKNHIITTSIEHDCVENTCKWLEGQGVKVTYLKVDKFGFIDLKELEKSITKKTFLISIIHGNNEIGTIQNLAEISKIAKKKKVLFHTDACQSYIKEKIQAKDLDLITINSHKIHGPKGVGALYIKEGVKIQPLLHGGGHERGLRSTTENVAGIVGFGRAVEVSKNIDYEKISELRDYLIQELMKKIPRVKLNGPMNSRLCNNISVTFGDVEGETIGSYLENKGIAISTGSACSSHNSGLSHVLKAIGLTKLEQNSTIRISLSKYTTKKEIKNFMKVLPGVIEKLRRLSPLIK